MSFRYADEKLMNAVRTLATGSGRIQERLADAALELIRLKPTDVPEGDLRKILIGILDDLTFEIPEGVEGRIAATLRITGDEDARAIAGRIVGLYHSIRQIADS